jgi:hypothetical protein
LSVLGVAHRCRAEYRPVKNARRHISAAPISKVSA